MALPTTNLTFHAKADTNSDVWLNYQAGAPYHNTNGAEGDNIAIWDDADGKALSFEYPITVANGPTYKVTTPLMPLPCLHFNGSSEFLGLFNDDATAYKAMSDIWGVGAKTLLIAFYIESVVTNQAEANQNETIFSDCARDSVADGGYFGLHLKNTGSGYKLIVYNWDGNTDTVELDVELNTPYVATMRHNGTNLYLSLNGGSESSTPSGNTTDVAGTPCIGRGYFSFNEFFNGRIGEIALYNAALAGTDLIDANSYFTDKWLAAIPQSGTYRMGYRAF